MNKSDEVIPDKSNVKIIDCEVGLTLEFSWSVRNEVDMLRLGPFMIGQVTRHSITHPNIWLAQYYNPVELEFVDVGKPSDLREAKRAELLQHVLSILYR